MSEQLRRHVSLARDTWLLIKGLALDASRPREATTLDDVDAAAMALIEMACDAAAESQRMALGYPPKGVR